MSGGQLVVVDRQGRDVKTYPLADGLVTLGSGPECDIRVMLPSVSSHHATVVVHANKTTVKNVGDGDTLVNGTHISVASLDHGDVITLGDRCLRWEYTNPPSNPQKSITTGGLLYRESRSRRARRATAAGAANATAKVRAVQLAIEMSHRASMPASSGGKQVAVVQPQRRDHNDKQTEKRPNLQVQQASKRPRNTNAETPTVIDEDKSKRKVSPRNITPQGTTKAAMWIESRKRSPRKRQSLTPASIPSRATAARPAARNSSAVARAKNTPLRTVVLRKVQSAQKYKVMKIEEPIKIDQTKQAAIMLMTGHAAKYKQASTSKIPTYIVKKPSPVKKTSRTATTPATATTRSTSDVTRVVPSVVPTPRRYTSYNNKSTRILQNKSVSALEISQTQNKTSRRSSTPKQRRSGKKSPLKSPSKLNPKKSALKDPKKSTRKTESIKFDLSNLENTQELNKIVTENTMLSDDNEAFTLRYSDTSSNTPSPRRSIHSRSSRILEKSTGVPMTVSPSKTYNVEHSSTVRKSTRTSLIMQKALELSDTTYEITHTLSPKSLNKTYDLEYFSTVTKSARTSQIKQKELEISDATYHETTHTLSARPNTNLESYSIVDLVSIDSNFDDSRSTSVYNSVASDSNFDTPQNTRSTRSTINPTLLGSSTPYDVNYSENSTRSTRSHSNMEVNSQNVTNVTSTRRSKSLSTPENTRKPPSLNRTKITRPSRSRSRLIDSDLILIDGDDSDASPKSSKRVNRTTKSVQYESNIQNESNSRNDKETLEDHGTTTPEIPHTLEDPGTPVISIQSLLNSSQNSIISQDSRTAGRSAKKKMNENNDQPVSMSARKTRLNLTREQSNSDNETETQDGEEDVVTPKSAVKLVREEVKKKHSTAKKTQSKRSIIDDLNESDIIKQLFNSPVKRKLSQSMKEFSRKQLFDDDDVTRAKRPARNTIANIDVATTDHTVMDCTTAISPEVFVSPLGSPRHTLNMTGIKRLFSKTTPQNDLRNIGGVKALLRTPRMRKSIKNDLRNVSGVQLIFAKSPENHLSDVYVKHLYEKSPKNDLSDVRGVKRLFRKSPKNDLRNVSGVKRTMRNNSPRNDLSDLRGVCDTFRREKTTEESDFSGIRELFDESGHDTNALFDRLLEKSQPKSVYSKTFSKRSHRQIIKSKSLRKSIDAITNNVDEWLEMELQKCVNDKNNSLRRELKKLETDTVQGTTPIRTARIRDSTIAKCSEGESQRMNTYSARKLPIKKRSLRETTFDKSRVEKQMLPIKKRKMMSHSTPVKNNLTINASDLTQMSPIHKHVGLILDTTQQAYILQQNITKRSMAQLNSESSQPEEKTKKTQKKVRKSEVKISPRKTRAKTNVNTNNPTTKQTKTRRGTKLTDTERVTKTRNSLVISKKPPVLTPKSNPKKNIVKRDKVVNREQTPKINTRTRKQRVSIVVNRPSPVARPRVYKKQTVKESDKMPEILQENTMAKTIRKTALKESQVEGRKTRAKTNTKDTQQKSAEKKTGKNTVATEKTAAKRTKTAKANKTDAIEPKTRRNGRQRAPKEIASDETETKQNRNKTETKGRKRNAVDNDTVTKDINTTTRGRRKIVKFVDNEEKMDTTKVNEMVHKKTTKTTRNRKNTEQKTPVETKRKTVQEKPSNSNAGNKKNARNQKETKASSANASGDYQEAASGSGIRRGRGRAGTVDASSIATSTLRTTRRNASANAQTEQVTKQISLRARKR